MKGVFNKIILSILISCVVIVSINLSLFLNGLSVIEKKVDSITDQANNLLLRADNLMTIAERLPLTTIQRHINNVLSTCDERDCFDRFVFALINRSVGYESIRSIDTPYNLSDYDGGLS